MQSPLLDIRAGDPDWGGAEWKRPATPARWMRHSIVWYSQRIAEELGAERLTDYARRFGYGNADFSGDPGEDNGLQRAWIASSLAISPAEQAAFLSAFVNRTLPVAPAVFGQVEAIVETNTIDDGWTVSGKTGSAYPRKADGSFDRNRGYGWYVGWAEKGERRAVFARLIQDEKREKVSGGLRTRAALFEDLPALLNNAGVQ
jgi:beta-lactamase class D